MKNISKILGLGILSLAALSCTKESPSGPDHTDSPTISIAADVPATKGFIDGSFPTGSQITVYDWLDVASGTDSYHMSNVGVKYSGKNAKDWSYTDSNAQYFWLDGTHNFFGWMTHEGTGANSTPISYSSLWSFNETSKVLTVKEIAFTPSSSIYDFVYSDIVSVPYSKGVTSTPDMVMLDMKHLFTAISFGAINNTKSNIVIEEFSINDLYSKNSASINYNNSNNGVVVASYGAGVKQTGAYRTATNVSLDGRSGAVSYNNVFTSSNNQEYMIMWPHETSKLHSNEEPTTDADGAVTYPASYLMHIKYTMDGTEYEKRINFPEGTAWEPGKRYHYDIEFADKTIKLTCTVNPWRYNDFDIDFATETVTMKASGALTWSQTASTVEGYNVYIKNNQPAVGSFHFDTPKGGNWIATLSGDVDAFYLEPSTGAINETSSQIRVVPIHTGDRERDYKVTVEFFVRRSDGRTIAADSQVQPTKYTIVHQKNKF